MDNYPAEAIALAASNGWDYYLHALALEKNDEDWIGVTHPINWLSEEQAERLFA